MEDNFFINSKDEKETIELGKKIGEISEKGQIILLTGELGSGKTRFVQGLAVGLGLNTEVTSPTYSLINEYEGEISFYHMDLYRLDNEVDLYNIGFEDYLYRDGIVAVEWPELAFELIPDDFLLLEFKIVEEENRKIKITGRGRITEKILKGLREDADIRN